MAIDSRIGNKVQKSLRREEAPATRVDPHPYIGIVKNNLDPTRCGRLQVWIPDLGGNQDDPKNWRTVSYASPFMGTTNISNGASKTPNTDNKFTNTPHTYGMWMVPPDIGVEVIVLFIAGDPLRGYWIACVNSAISRYMIPAIAAAGNITLKGASPDVAGTLGSKSVAPVTEFNDNDPTIAQNPAFYTNSKPVHEPQYRVLKEQGLDRDFARGLITSSSQRESPSSVFGISTPGRPFNDPADDPNFLAKVAAGTLTETDYAYKTRKGGHSLVMDDGNITGADQLVRLRTAHGHQIMMNDSENTLYINHADGTGWVEFDTNGAINIYSKSGFNVRTEGTLNLHADADININAGGKLRLNSGSWESTSGSVLFTHGDITLQSTGATNIKSGPVNIDGSAKISVKAGGILALEGSGIYQNSGKAESLNLKPTQNLNNLPDVTRASSTALWIAEPNLIQSIVTAAPTHEPYPRAQETFAAVPTTGIQPQATYTSGVDAIKNLSGTGVRNPAGDKQIRNQPPTDCQVGKLSKDEMTALFAQTGFSESGGDYTKQNSIGYVGKYQFGRLALIDAGYVKSSCTSNAQLNNPNSWTGKNGISSIDDWKSNGSTQESAMCDIICRNYSQMVKSGAITADMSNEEVAGMLSVAHLLGAGGANTWRKGGGGADANGTTGDDYFQRGKYAVAVLAPKVPAIQQG